MTWHWLLVPAAYLLGSVSFAYLAGRLKGIDLRQQGSRNLGATNAGRVLGKGWFFAVFACDLAKGLAAVEAGHQLAFHGGSAWLPLAGGAAAILGHSFTCFHGFTGGKAVATSLGVLIGLLWKVAAICLSVWLVAWLIGWLVFRTGAANAVAPASILAALAVPMALFATTADPFSAAHLPVTVFCFLLSALVVVRHRSNIARLFGRPPAQR
jgi:acyl phosphate:glycerol-3-phosphate acyltransferase